MKLLSLTVGLLLVAGCGEEEPVVLIPDFASRSRAVECEPLPGPDPPPEGVTRLQPMTDSTFLLVDGAGRELVILDRGGRRIGGIRLTQDGPLGVAMLTDAAFSSDTLLVVADGGRQRLRAFDVAWRDLWTLELDFPPQRLAFAGRRLLVAAAGMDARLPGLLYAMRGSTAEPLGVPLAAHPDGLARLFLNDVMLHGYPDGSALLANRFVRPRAWRVDPANGVSRLTVPLPAAARDGVGYLPPIPFREEEIGRIAAPVIASASDPRTNDLLYLTRSGRQREGRSEKALVRADRELRYIGSRLLDVNAIALAYLPADPATAVVVDYENDWFRCEAP